MYIPIKDHNEDMARLRAKHKKEIAKLKSMLCDTCGGAGSVMIAIDDGIDCPACLETGNKIKAEGIREFAKLMQGLASDAGEDKNADLYLSLVFSQEMAIGYASNLASDRED